MIRLHVTSKIHNPQSKEGLNTRSTVKEKKSAWFTLECRKGDGLAMTQSEPWPH